MELRRTRPGHWSRTPHARLICLITSAPAARRVLRTVKKLLGSIQALWLSLRSPSSPRLRLKTLQPAAQQLDNILFGLDRCTKDSCLYRDLLNLATSASCRPESVRYLAQLARRRVCACVGEGAMKQPDSYTREALCTSRALLQSESDRRVSAARRRSRARPAGSWKGSPQEARAGGGPGVSHRGHAGGRPLS